MAHFGLLSYSGTGHLNPLFTLARRLVSRGHRVTVFQRPEMEQTVRQHGLEFYSILPPSRRIPAVEEPSGWFGCFKDIRTRVENVEHDMQHFLRCYPPALQTVGVDVLLIGEIALAGPTVAEQLRLPYFIVSTTIPHNFGWHAPRYLRPRLSLRKYLQRELLQISVLRMRGPIRRSLDRYRLQMGMLPIPRISDNFPELAHITQWPRSLDIPRRKLPHNFCYAGPFVDSSARPPIDFPWHRLDGRPLVYASLGTTRKGHPDLFRKIAEACEQLGLQAVITLGGSRSLVDIPQLPGNAIAVPNAPQLELLSRADIVVTHAGPNTVLETLLQGKPMLALPITLDQPAVAGALVRLGAAEALPPQHRSVADIRGALRRLCNNPSYRTAAQSLQKQIAAHNGLDSAVKCIEEKLPKRTDWTT